MGFFNHLTSVVILALLLTACGGGSGGGSSSDGIPNSTGSFVDINSDIAIQSYSGTTNPVRLKENNTLEISQAVFLGVTDNSSSTIVNSQSVDSKQKSSLSNKMFASMQSKLAQRSLSMITQPSKGNYTAQQTFNENTNCDYGGSVNIQGDIGYPITTGHFTITYNQCAIDYNNTYSGTATFNILQVNSYGDPTEFSMLADNLVLQVSNVQYSATGNIHSTIDDFGYTTLTSNMLRTRSSDHLQILERGLVIVHKVDGADVSGNICQQHLGCVTLETKQLLRFDYSGSLIDGELLMTGSNNTKARLTAGVYLDAAQYFSGVKVEVDSDGDGIYESTQFVHPSNLLQNAEIDNRAPIADFTIYGPNCQHVTGSLEGDQCILSGYNSSDPDGDQLSYFWQVKAKPENSQSTISEPYAINNAKFKPDIEGNYIISLTVTDPYGKTSTLEKTLIAVDNYTPVAKISDFSFYENSCAVGATCRIEGSQSYDPNGSSTTLQYAWEVIQKPDNAQITIYNQDGYSNTSSRFAFSTTVAGDYTVQLTLTDSDGFSNTTTKIFTFSENQSPTAKITSSQSTSIDCKVVASVIGDNDCNFRGDSSTDPENETLTYQWSLSSQPAQSQATLYYFNNPNTSFTPDTAGNYTLSLTVTDEHGNTDTTTETVTIEANQAPEAAIDLIKCNNFPVKNVCTLSSNSWDPEWGEITHYWELIARPENSSAQLIETTGFSIQFTPDQAGQYTIRLTVTDNAKNTGIDEVVVNITNGEATSPIGNGAPRAVIDVQCYSFYCIANAFSSTDPDNDPLSYAWTVNNTTPAYSDDEPVIVLDSDTPGDHTISLTVTDSLGNSDTTQKTIQHTETY